MAGGGSGDADDGDDYYQYYCYYQLKTVHVAPSYRSSTQLGGGHYIDMLDELMATGMYRQDMLDVFINTQEEDFLEALHCVFREAVNARGANKQQLFLFSG